MNESVSSGILHGFSHGLLTSTSVLMNAPGCAPALAQWKDLDSRLFRGELPSIAVRRRLADNLTPFDLGIHLNLTQGRPLTGTRYPRQLLDRDGRFPGLVSLAARLFVSGWRFRDAIQDELSAQIEALLGQGIAPTHLNTHHHIEIHPVVSSIIPVLLGRYAIPVVRVPWETHLTQTALIQGRQPMDWFLAQLTRPFALHYLVKMRSRGVVHPAAYFGLFHAGRLDLGLMRSIVSAAPSGVTEVGIHPGLDATSGEPEAAADGWHDPMASARVPELALLTSSELAGLLEARGVRLGRLSDVVPH